MHVVFMHIVDAVIFMHLLHALVFIHILNAVIVGAAVCMYIFHAKPPLFLYALHVSHLIRYYFIFVIFDYFQNWHICIDSLSFS